MSPRRKKSVSHNVIGKKWIYLETPHRQCRPSQKVTAAPRYGAVSFYRVDNFMG